MGFLPPTSTNNMTTAYRPGFTGDSQNSRHFWCQGPKNALRFLQIVPSKIPMRGLLSHFPVQENTKVYGARVRELIIKLRYTATFFFGFPLLLTDGQQTSKPPTHLRCAIPGARTGETRATSTCPTPGSFRRTWPRTSGPSIGLKASRRLLPRRSERTSDRLTRCPERVLGPLSPKGVATVAATHADRMVNKWLGRVPPTFFGCTSCNVNVLGQNW